MATVTHPRQPRPRGQGSQLSERWETPDARCAGGVGPGDQGLRRLAEDYAQQRRAAWHRITRAAGREDG